MDDAIIVGHRFSSEEGSVARFPTGRVCGREGCHTHLSIYNDGDFCARHEPMTSTRTRGVRTA